MQRTFYDSLKELSGSDDFAQTSVHTKWNSFYLSYYNTLISKEQLHHEILTFLKTPENSINHLQELRALIPIQDIRVSSGADEIMEHLMNGFVFIQLDENYNEGILINISDLNSAIRKNNDTENEYSVVGPKVGFVEDIDTNLKLIRRIIKSDKLKFEESTVGSLSKTRVAIGYIDGITSRQHVNTVRQRLSDFDFDVIFDSSFIDQIITDNSNSPFPLFMTSERVDRIKYALISGQLVIVCNGSPYVLIGPATIFDFFISPEDYYLPWVIGSFFRLIRYFGVLFSIMATPIYVAVTSFHYSVIPWELMGSIIDSRVNVPFMPVVEALFLEITIELLREAGARLPTKVGQTLGIVGGIVIGQAAVAAALTSNILLIFVSLSALASFTTPIYKMSNTIRFLRFPLIGLAALWGGLGIMMGIVLILGHLLRLKSLGNPYLVPMFPFRYKDYRDSFVRSSVESSYLRPGYLRPLTQKRYNVRPRNDKGDNFNEE
ncbi:spore germination protein [Paenibacillus prosopidis]|uniref:GerA spore germination protein n=1 Tax=Paenibacillus prosopidis TaxID=630520 RepID=A0A368W0K6_9BACL|nr:spore germination protein [Paenibacillus prosopidis]RCW48362.1 GerA spore germination protein [Paenibacillus prosopidis]